MTCASQLTHNPTGWVRLLLGAWFAFHAGPEVALAQNVNDRATVEQERELVEQYCVVCHGVDTQLGNFSWATVDVAHPEQNAQQAEKIIRKLRAGMMPPAGMPRPEAEALEAVALSLETRVDRAVASRPHAAPPALHRIGARLHTRQ